MTIHTELIDEIINGYGEYLTDTPKQTHDAVSIFFRNHLKVELRFASSQEYSLGWRFGEQEFRIDTAPLHPDLSSFPNHLHLPDGTVRDDPLTTPGRSPLDNIRSLLDTILENPVIT